VLPDPRVWAIVPAFQFFDRRMNADKNKEPALDLNVTPPCGPRETLGGCVRFDVYDLEEGRM